MSYSKIKYVIERQGFADDNTEYIRPEIVPNLINEKQNKEILDYAKTRFSPSLIGGGGTNPIIDNEIRKSETAWIPKEESIVKPLIQNICNKYGLNFANAEDLQVVKYEKNNFYNEHHDSFPDYHADFLAEGGHRVLTCLIYLNDNFDGGETKFPNLDVNIKPVRNSAVVFRPLANNEKKCHPLALHAGLPVESGIKYVCNLWVRENEFKQDEDSLEYKFNNAINTLILDGYKLILWLQNYFS